MLQKVPEELPWFCVVLVFGRDFYMTLHVSLYSRNLTSFGIL